jgi:hypothetical protein
MQRLEMYNLHILMSVSYVITPYIRMLDSDWLIAVIFFFLQIQHFEFAEFLLHVGVFA